jgi:hypothetical protein
MCHVWKGNNRQFETLWKNAIPAEEEIKEIEEGMKPPFTETLKDPSQIQEVVFDLVNSAKQEILMLVYSNTVIGNIFLKVGYEEVAQRNATRMTNPYSICVFKRK